MIQPELFIITLLLLIAHFIGDFCYFYKPLHLKIQNAKVTYTNIFYIWVHGYLNAFIYSIVAAVYVKDPSVIVFVFLIEFISHSLFDITKSWLNNFKKLDITNYWYWFILGLDQLLHCVVLLYLAHTIYFLS